MRPRCQIHVHTPIFDSHFTINRPGKIQPIAFRLLHIALHTFFSFHSPCLCLTLTSCINPCILWSKVSLSLSRLISRIKCTLSPLPLFFFFNFVSRRAALLAFFSQTQLPFYFTCLHLLEINASSTQDASCRQRNAAQLDCHWRGSRAHQAHQGLHRVREFIFFWSTEPFWDKKKERLENQDISLTF